jgi:hypothetical protein
MMMTNVQTYEPSTNLNCLVSRILLSSLLGSFLLCDLYLWSFSLLNQDHLLVCDASMQHARSCGAVLATIYSLSLIMDSSSSCMHALCMDLPIFIRTPFLNWDQCIDIYSLKNKGPWTISTSQGTLIEHM